MSRLWMLRSRLPEESLAAVQSFLEPRLPLRLRDISRRLIIGEYVDAYVDGVWKMCRVDGFVAYVPGLYSEPTDEQVLLHTVDQRGAVVHRSLVSADSGEWFVFRSAWFRFFGVPPPFRTLDEAFAFGWPCFGVRRGMDGAPVRHFE